jgi:hypothetical protein
MANPDQYEIIFYLPPGGECRVQYDTKAKYDSALAFLDARRLEGSPIYGEGGPLPRTTYYYIEDDQTEAVEEFFRWSKQHQ